MHRQKQLLLTLALLIGLNNSSAYAIEEGIIAGLTICATLGFTVSYGIYKTHDIIAYGSGKQRVENLKKLQELEEQKKLFERGLKEREVAFLRYQKATEHIRSKLSAFWQTTAITRGDDGKEAELLFGHYLKIVEKTGSILDSDLEEKKAQSETAHNS